ncbi:MAG: hypothetical protein MH112_11215 [Phenylobacterium sp.]|uniref:hypothetical protein n=1 Tax=Phenylobacterium sp. TaxID=1871053 RepID=UPI0025ED98C8|nr:hypothetical protein [Phenylobacterium sp.]MCG9916908.1 hypothetical protein [Phenylobacterium sp.]
MTRKNLTMATTPDLLPGSAHAFERLAAAIQILSEMVPPRLSARQLLAFSIIAYANAMGRRITLAEVREIAGDGLGVSIERTINSFFEPTRREPDGLGWLEQVPDEDDRRRKFLVLTAEGRRAVNEITAAFTATERELPA